MPQLLNRLDLPSGVSFDENNNIIISESRTELPLYFYPLWIFGGVFWGYVSWRLRFYGIAAIRLGITLLIIALTLLVALPEVHLSTQPRIVAIALIVAGLAAHFIFFYIDVFFVYSGVTKIIPVVQEVYTTLRHALVVLAEQRKR